MYYHLSRRDFMLALTGITGTILTACGSTLQKNSPLPSTTNPPNVANMQPVPAGTLTTASITVGAITENAIIESFAGLSYEKSSLYEPLFLSSNTALIGLFTRLGTSILRIGGNSVDKNIWTPNGSGQTAGEIAPSDVDALASFVQATGWKVLYGINLGGSASGTTTPELAAAEVAYVSSKLGSSLLGIEIGNECDLYGDTGSYYAGNWSLAQFQTLWNQYRSAILAVTPHVAITGPASAGNISKWTIPFGDAVTSNSITLLTQHYYRANGALPTSTVDLLISPDATLVSDLALLKNGAMNIGVPFRISECNSYYNGGASGVSDSYASSLWVIDYLFDCVQGGASGVNFHGGGNSGGYTPIANSSGTVVGARPEYYGILLFTLAGNGYLYQTQVSVNSLNVTAYTVKNSDNDFRIVIINKDATANLECSIALPIPVNSASLLEMTQNSPGSTSPSLTATSGVTIQGAQVATNGNFTPAIPYTLAGGKSSLTCYVPALSAVLISVT